MMDKLNNNSIWEQPTQGISDFELHAQNLDRMKIISTELIKLAQESQQHAYSLNDKHELRIEQIIHERDCLIKELTQEQDKNRELTAKLNSIEKQLVDMQENWTPLYEQIQKLDADMKETIGKKRKIDQ